MAISYLVPLEKYLIHPINLNASIDVSAVLTRLPEKQTNTLLFPKQNQENYDFLNEIFQM